MPCNAYLGRASKEYMVKPQFACKNGTTMQPASFLFIHCSIWLSIFVTLAELLPASTVFHPVTRPFKN